MTTPHAQLLHLRACIKRDRAAAQGFNVYHWPRISCDACAAVCINGVPCHERGCPNERHECNGCNELIPINQRYCEDCAS